MGTMSNLFLLKHVLPQEMLSSIYEYDDTYKRIFDDKVKLELWREVWFRWNEKQSLPEIKFVMDYLFTIWGIDTRNSNPNINLSWHLHKLNPDDIKFVIGICPYYKRMSVKVVGKNWDSLFEGYVYSRKDYYNEVVNNEGTNNMFDVYEDDKRHLVIDFGQN
jgi:hypothetical protein